MEHSGHGGRDDPGTGAKFNHPGLFWGIGYDEWGVKDMTGWGFYVAVERVCGLPGLRMRWTPGHQASRVDFPYFSSDAKSAYGFLLVGEIEFF